jgi:hypothetical protein
VLETLQKITRSIQALIGKSQKATTTPIQELQPDTQIGETAESTATQLEATNAKVQELASENQELKHHIETIAPLAEVGKKVRACNLMLLFAKDHIDHDVKREANKSAHEAQVLADAVLLKYFPSYLGHSSKHIKMERIYEVSEDTVWENREFYEFRTVMEWQFDVNDWYPKGYLAKWDIEEFNECYGDIMRAFEDRNGLIGQEAYRKNAPTGIDFKTLEGIYLDAVRLKSKHFSELESEVSVEVLNS